MITILADGAVPAASLRHPRIGYDNAAAATDATITTDSVASGYAAANPFDWKPYTYWKPATGGEHYIQIVTADTVTVDYVALAQHNLGDNNGTFQLQYSVDAGANWLDATTDYAPTAREQLWIDVTPVVARYWRIVTNSVDPSVIGIVSFGVKYKPQRGKFSGFTPPGMARSFTPYASSSEGGLFLGRSILRRQLRGSISFDLMEIADVYAYWVPFMQAAEAHPFFLVWMLEDYPEDVQLVETRGDWSPPTISEFGYMSVSFAYAGILQE